MIGRPFSLVKASPMAQPPIAPYQRDYWSGDAGQRWAQWASRTDHALSDVTKLLLARIKAQPGEVILDVGCGAGELSLLLADQLGVEGRVYGVDISPPLLAEARAREKQAVRAPHWIEADAQNAEWYRQHDAIVSRFGVMFFEDPPAAFANLAKALKAGGRMVFACWQGPEVNPFFSELGALARRIKTDLPPADPQAPGPMSLADPARIRSLLESAGFADIEISDHPMQHHASHGPDALNQAIEYFMEIGPMAMVATQGTPTQQAEARVALREYLAGHQQGESVSMPGRIWCVRAVKSAEAG